LGAGGRVGRCSSRACCCSSSGRPQHSRRVSSRAVVGYQHQPAELCLRQERAVTSSARLRHCGSCRCGPVLQWARCPVSAAVPGCRAGESDVGAVRQAGCCNSMLRLAGAPRLRLSFALSVWSVWRVSPLKKSGPTNAWRWSIVHTVRGRAEGLRLYSPRGCLWQWHAAPSAGAARGEVP
jgi:hypothetical protein